MHTKSVFGLSIKYKALIHFGKSCIDLGHFKEDMSISHSRYFTTL